MEMSTIMAGIGSLKSAGDILKGAMQIAGDLKEGDLVQKLVGVQQALLEAKEQLMALTEENMRLRGETEELRKAAEFKGKLEFDLAEQIYSLKDRSDADHSRFCPHCLDGGTGVRRRVAKELHGLEIEVAALRTTQAWQCPQCKSYYRRITPMPSFS